MVGDRRAAADDGSLLSVLDQAGGVIMATSNKYGLTYDVIIIGSGVAGALVAYKLAKEKVRVLILEAGGTPSEMADRRLLVMNYAAASSKGQDSPYTDEVRKSQYYSSPPAVTAPQPQDEPIDDDLPYYRYSTTPDTNHKFKSFYERVVGGSAWHWQGLSPRMLPNDFQMKTAFFKDDADAAKTYPGVRDWPISYSDLLPYYREAEYEMGVAGNVTTDRELDRYFGIKEAAGDRGYPPGFREGIPMTYLDQYIRRKLQGSHYKETSPDAKTSIDIPLWVTQVPQAKNARPFDGRPACDGRGTCVPLCPSRAKYEAVFHVEKAVKAGAELQANAVVTQLKFGSSGEVTEVAYKDWQLLDRTVSGRIVVLAGNAIESPRLLLHSETPEKANPVIGKYLMDHPGSASYGLVPDPVYPFRGPSTTSQIDTTRDGPFRKWRAGFRTSLLNYGWQMGVLRGGTWDPAPNLDHGDDQKDRGGNVLDLVHTNHMIGSTLRERLQHHAHRQVFLGTALEQLPCEANSVQLVKVVDEKKDKDRFGIPLPLITYYYDDPSGYTGKGLEVAQKLHKAIFERLGATAYRLYPLKQGVLTEGYFGAGHIMGTTRMGKDGEARVVDGQCRSVDHPNLYIVGSSVFVTGAVANPTLTLAALSLRAADAIKAELRRS
jgi:choline dehydrogenase-like flavoprotein